MPDWIRQFRSTTFICAVVFSVTAIRPNVARATRDFDNRILIWDLDRLQANNKSIRKKRTRDKLEKQWKELGGWRFDLAMDKLAASPDQTVEFLAKRLRPIPRVDIAKLVRQLGAKHYAVRERAKQKIEALEFAAIPELEMTLKYKPPLEIARRAKVLLQSIKM